MYFNSVLCETLHTETILLFRVIYQHEDGFRGSDSNAFT